VFPCPLRRSYRACISELNIPTKAQFGPYPSIKPLVVKAQKSSRGRWQNVTLPHLHGALVFSSSTKQRLLCMERKGLGHIYKLFREAFHHTWIGMARGWHVASLKAHETPLLSIHNYMAAKSGGGGGGGGETGPVTLQKGPVATFS
jgi:hypothetical protein